METNDSQFETDVIIVGGGLAGLAAAAMLGREGLRVTLLEARPRLGGRATSIPDQATGELIDNCQHVSMGCCTNFSHFCRTTGIDRFFVEEQELTFIGPDRKPNRFRADFLPAPLHLGSSFRKFSFLSIREKISLAKSLRELAGTKRTQLLGKTIADWLGEQHLSERVVQQFWHVVLVSALSESLDRIDAAMAQKVIVDGFLRNRGGWKVSVPIEPLGTVYGQHLADWLADHNTRIRLKSGVDRVVVEENRCEEVRLRNGESLNAKATIIAVPQPRAVDLLSTLNMSENISELQPLESAPISSIHLWFDRPITPLRHAVFTSGLSQWIFNRTLIHNKNGTAPSSGYYYQVVISASGELATRPRESVIKQVVDELATYWSAVSEANLLHSRMLTEHHAVFSPLPNIEDARPSQHTKVRNLFLAGDWTRTGWPATMEGAVRSGYLAAEACLKFLGTPRSLLQPDLATSWLSRLLLRIDR